MFLHIEDNRRVFSSDSSLAFRFRTLSTEITCFTFDVEQAQLWLDKDYPVIAALRGSENTLASFRLLPYDTDAASLGNALAFAIAADIACHISHKSYDGGSSLIDTTYYCARCAYALMVETEQHGIYGGADFLQASPTLRTNACCNACKRPVSLELSVF